jgi:hypothetical protein
MSIPPIGFAGALRPLAGVCLLVSGCMAGETPHAADGERPPRRIQEPPAEFPAQFSVIRTVMALPDGRLVVSDPHENRIALIDFANGTRQELSSIGEGPREYRLIGGLYRGRGGRVMILDRELRRLLPIAPDGGVEDAVGLSTGGAAGSRRPRAPDPLMVDSLGHAFAVRRLGFITPTSMLLRYRPGERPDTITELLKPLTKVLEGDGYGPGVYQDVLFSPEDDWVTSPDGRIAVVRAEPYRIEWFTLAGLTVTGPVIRHEPVPITQAEKELIASGAGGSRGRIEVTMGMVPAGAAAGSRPSAPSPMPVEDLLFAKVKSPVNLRDGRRPMLDERGRLWVERSMPAEVKGSVFDVFDGNGTVVDRIELPPGSRLVGFDPDWIYAARLDDDGFEHLQRFPLPR